MSVKLTDDQTNAWNMVIDFVNDPNPPLPEVAVLGFAGTGKTYLIRRLIHELVQAGISVVCTAPTNKAVQVLRRGQEGLFATRFQTLHSFLGLKPIINQRTGEEEFVPDPNRPVGNADLLIVDEASMVGHGLYALTHQAKQPHTRLLWVGDPAQLPPVNEEASQALLCPTQYTLRQVVRFGNAIERYVTAVRGAVEAESADVPPPEDSHENDEGVYVLPRTEWLARLLEDFKSEAFRCDPNFVRALAWRNNLVSWGNRTFHQLLYGADAYPFVAGQVLTARTPVFVPGERTILMATSDECRVLEASSQRQEGFDCWRLIVQLGDGETATLYTVDPMNTGGFMMKLENLKLAALHEGDEDERRRKWRHYYRYREMFADLWPCYWSTVHKGQGSTFTRAYVAGGDIGDNPNKPERHRMLYTAYTRASKQLVITQ